MRALPGICVAKIFHGPRHPLHPGVYRQVRWRATTLLTQRISGQFFHTKMKIKDIDLQTYLFNTDVADIMPHEALDITNKLRKEMTEIYSGMNIY